MLPTTEDAIRAVINVDPSLRPEDRRALLERLRQPLRAETAADSLPPPRLLRRKEVAHMLGTSTRTVDKLAVSGALKRRVLPGRSRAAGFLETDVLALLA